MTSSGKKNRIIFIDLMRAFAVLQMVQGHTTDVLLSNEFRNPDNSLYSIWLFMRGMTAPIFLFTAGTVFTYLFKLINEPFETNPRVKKGFKRFLLLVFLGYMLRYPTATIVYFGDVTAAQWQTFLSVDVLQLIGFGILFTIMFIYLAEKSRINEYIVFSTGTLLFFAIAPFFETIDWKSFLPVPVAAYFYKGTGSLFPLFPWAGFVVAGGVLGLYLANNPLIFKSEKLSLRLALAGLLFIVLAAIGNFIGHAYWHGYAWDTGPNLTLMRLGFVLLLNALVSLICVKIDSIPRFIILIGRNTLLIYIVHLAILYGSAWNPGVIMLFNKSFNVWQTVASALFMFVLMSGMVYIIYRYKIKNKELVA